jgi:uncharacterized delta-60 repeat protein
MEVTLESPSPLPLLLLGAKTPLEVRVKRSTALEAARRSVAITLKSAAKVNAPTIVVGPDEQKGTLEITADHLAAQGPVDLTLEAAAGGDVKSSKPLKMFIRGQPGTLDTTFGTQGVATVDGGPGFVPRAITVRTDDTMVALGQCPGQKPSCLVALTRDGNPDPAFGASGKLVVDFAAYPRAITSQPDGAILVATDLSEVANISMALYRYTAGGDIDTSFGGGTAFVNQQTAGTTRTLDIASDGTVVFGFEAQRPEGVSAGLVRFTSKGERITANGGFAFAQFGSLPTYLVGYSPTPTGEIIGAAINLGQGTTDGKAIVFRFTATHVLDKAFGTGGSGYTSTNIPKLTESGGRRLVQRLSDGSIVAAYYAYEQGKADMPYIARYKATGTLDSTWGKNGIVGTETTLSEGLPQAMLVDATNRVLFSSPGVTKTLSVTRLDDKGARDTSFGPFGSRKYDPPNARLVDMAAQSDGRIVIAAVNGDPPNTKFLLLRVWH